MAWTLDRNVGELSHHSHFATGYLFPNRLNYYHGTGDDCFISLPNVLILPFAGMIVDRIDRIRLLLFTNIARFGLMFIAAVLMFTGGMKLPVLFVGLALYGLMDGIFNPAYSALRAQVFTPDIRNAANALVRSVYKPSVYLALR